MTEQEEKCRCIKCCKQLCKDCDYPLGSYCDCVCRCKKHTSPCAKYCLKGCLKGCKKNVHTKIKRDIL